MCPSDSGPPAGGETLTLDPHASPELAESPDDSIHGELPECDPDRYELLGEHARGGIGKVLRVRDRYLDRVVAIKMLMSTSNASRARFEREARITARLEHPSIVPVHEAGRWPTGEPFYAMKLVSGRPLRDVIREATTRNERLALLPTVSAVAEAIAYAHSEGVIHRDLKPSNILVGEYGETVVVDWGLARRIDGDDDRAGDDGPYRAAGSPNVTRAGDVLGTPAYMSPEQARGERTDERADVYALGAILYETLTGAHPYSGGSSDEVIRKVIAEPPPPIGEVEPNIPPDLVAIVSKAMARDPDQRYRNADGLGLDLRRYLTGQLVRAHRYSARERISRWATRHRAALGGVALAAAAGVATFALVGAPDTGPSCAVPDDALAGVWDPDVRARVSAAVSAAGDDGAAMFDRAAARLDAYADGWRAMRRGACEATHVRGVQSEAVLDLRMRCIDRRRADLAALTASLAELPEGTTPSRVLSAVFSLPPLDSCADVDALTAEVPPPPEPDRRAKFDELQASLSDVNAQRALGRTERAVEIAESLLEPARALGHDGVLAEVLVNLASVNDLIANVDRARDLFSEAAPIAARAGRPELVAKCWLELMMLYADRYRTPAEAKRIQPYAEAAVALAGDSPRLRAHWHETMGVVSWRSKQLETARDHLEKALAIYETGDDPVKVGYTHSDLGAVCRAMGKLDEAQAHYERGLDVFEENYGPNPTHAMSLLHNLATLYQYRGEHEAAMKTYERALMVKEAALGPDNPLVASTLTSMGIVHERLGQYDEALAMHQRALAIFTTKYEPGNYKIGYSHLLIGEVLADRGDYAGARDHIETARGVFRRSYEPDDPMFAEVEITLAQVDAAQGNPKAALARCERAQALRAQEPPSEENTVQVQMCLGDAYAELGKHAEAVKHYEISLAAQPSPDMRPEVRASTQLSLAKSLWESGGDRDRALQLARAARAAFDVPWRKDDLAHLDAWLAERQ